MPLVLCSDVTAADWIARSGVPWQQLVTFGPSGFAAYARLRLLPDPVHPGQRENDADPDGRADQLPALLGALAGRTTTPERCWFCVWEGFGQPVPADGDVVPVAADELGVAVRRSDARPGLAPAPAGTATVGGFPMVQVPHRAYWLFSGPLADVGRWDTARGRPGRLRLDGAPPAFVWPADRAWSVALDVDPHWAGIGGSVSLVEQLAADPRLDVVPADPTAPQPHYR